MSSFLFRCLNGGKDMKDILIIDILTGKKLRAKEDTLNHAELSVAKLNTVELHRATLNTVELHRAELNRSK